MALRCPTRSRSRWRRPRRRRARHARAQRKEALIPPRCRDGLVGTPSLSRGIADTDGPNAAFDSRRQPLAPVHFLATTAFVPVYPPVEIDGRLFADPGMVANLPLDPLFVPPPVDDFVCFAVDLFAPEGEHQRALESAVERVQDILFSAQSTRAIDARLHEHALRHAIAELGSRLGSRASRDPELVAFLDEGRTSNIDLVHVRYRALPHEIACKMLEYSGSSIAERWNAGGKDMNRAIDRLEANVPSVRRLGVALYRDAPASEGV